jgi:hypothetical protein
MGTNLLALQKNAAAKLMTMRFTTVSNVYADILEFPIFACRAPMKDNAGNRRRRAPIAAT